MFSGQLYLLFIINVLTGTTFSGVVSLLIFFLIISLTDRAGLWIFKTTRRKSAANFALAWFVRNIQESAHVSPV